MTSGGVASIRSLAAWRHQVSAARTYVQAWSAEAAMNSPRRLFIAASGRRSIVVPKPKHDARVTAFYVSRPRLAATPRPGIASETWDTASETRPEIHRDGFVGRALKHPGPVQGSRFAGLVGIDRTAAAKRRAVSIVGVNTLRPHRQALTKRDRPNAAQPQCGQQQLPPPPPNRNAPPRLGRPSPRPRCPPRG
jgi:hypothetical protein